MSTEREGPPPDDPSIAAEHNLLRRVPDSPRMVVASPDGTLRPSSAAFVIAPGEHGCSVDVQERLGNPEDPLSVLAPHPDGWGLAACTAGAARNDGENHVVGRPKPDNQAHAVVIPTAPARKAKKRSMKTLAERTTFLRDPVLPAMSSSD